MLRRLAMIAIAACTVAVTAYGDTAGQAGTPERIEPMRKRMLRPNVRWQATIRPPSVVAVAAWRSRAWTASPVSVPCPQSRGREGAAAELLLPTGLRFYVRAVSVM